MTDLDIDGTPRKHHALTNAGLAKAQAELEADQMTRKVIRSLCVYCAKAEAKSIARGNDPGYGMCKRHRDDAIVGYNTSPASEAYWCS